jgi:hypothetical protein
MRVAEVRPGMTGYGLSVFSGTAIERFDVEVVAILHNFNPRYDVVLIRCHGQNLEHTGPVEGMSGSPIFLRDDAGHYRMIGAFAYGWSMQKDPIAGVQPIEYMLNVGRKIPTAQPGASDEASPDATPPDDNLTTEELTIAGPAVWSLCDSPLWPSRKLASPAASLAAWNRLATRALGLPRDDSSPHLHPLATPLELSGVPTRLLTQLAPFFAPYGLVPLQAGGGGGGTAATQPGQPAPAIEPGSVLAVPLIGGDMDASAVGTCTERIGNHVLAFGHPLFGNGTVDLPMSGGTIQTVIANLASSFKLGSPVGVAGTLYADQSVGIAGTVGPPPPMIPIDLHVQYSDGSLDESFHFTCAVHAQLTPMLSALAIVTAVTAEHDLPEFSTENYNLRFDFGHSHHLDLQNTVVNANLADLLSQVVMPIMQAADNPFEKVMLQRITGTITVIPQQRSADILYADLPRSVYRPGETVRAYLTYRPFHGFERVMPVSMKLPEDLPDGTYSLNIGDAEKYMDDERTAEPFKFTAENIEQVFDVLRDTAAVPHKAVFIRLLRKSDGVAIGHTAMPKLPSSRRQVMLGAGRSDTTEFVSSALKIVPTALVMSGSCDFEITIDHNADTELATPAREPHRDVRPPPAAPAAPASALPAPAGSPSGKP